MNDVRPFSGITVLDLTRVIVGPYAAYQLALLGAKVIKIEEPGKGDTMRTKRGHAPELGKRGMQTSYLAHNSNKLAMTLNLRKSEGQDILRKLAAKADILMENFRGGTMERYGLGYQQLHALYPRLIYCSVTGYGHTGPKRTHAAYDPVIQAASGMMTVTGTTKTAPVKIGPSVVDYSAGLASAFGMATALFERERSGQGQHIDVSMLDSALSLMGSVITDVLTVGTEPKPGGNKSRHLDHYTNGCFQCADTLISLSASEPHHRDRLWPAMGREDIPLDPRFATPEASIQNITALHDEMEATFKTRDAQHWEDALNEAGIAAMRMRTIPDVLRTEQVQSRGFLHKFDHVAGAECSVTVPLTPFKLSRGTARADTPPPVLSQHTGQILTELGYSEPDIQELRKQGVV